MDVFEAVATRYSCRRFVDRPVPEEVVRDILSRAARAPSGGNLQPWRVWALAGDRLAALKSEVRARLPTMPKGEGPGYDIYPKNLAEPYFGRRHEVGEALYGALGIAREDKAGRLAQFARNFEFFGAPVGLFFAIDRAMGPPQWSDLGMYIVTAMLLARGHGLHTCGQEAWTYWHETVAAFLPVPDSHILFCGMALGYADEAAPVNGWRTAREPLAAFAALQGFSNSESHDSARSSTVHDRAAFLP